MHLKNNTKTFIKEKALCQKNAPAEDDFFTWCLQKGFIEKTSYGYYFTPEFFKILKKDTKKTKATEKKNICSH